MSVGGVSGQGELRLRRAGGPAALQLSGCYSLKSLLQGERPFQDLWITFKVLSQRLECAGSGRQEPTIEDYHAQEALELLWSCWLWD